MSLLLPSPRQLLPRPQRPAEAAARATLNKTAIASPSSCPSRSCYAPEGRTENYTPKVEWFFGIFLLASDANVIQQPYGLSCMAEALLSHTTSTDM